MAVLTKDLLWKFLCSGRIKVSPLLDGKEQVEEGSINLRLGTKFIVTRRSEYGIIQPRRLSIGEIRKFQMKLSYAIGSRFILHPGQLVLGGTFEFICLPTDVSGFVLSRSSYGRIGLLVATATYVHPGWKGCLTLELFNYGEAPIELECGSPIAQLVMQKAIRIKDVKKPKRIPIGPEFSSLSSQPVWQILAEFRRKRRELPD